MNRILDSLAVVQLDVHLDLPQIAVVGGQSVGKSSILESLVGRAFLPCGSGVVTRRPLILQLSNTKTAAPSGGHPEPTVSSGLGPLGAFPSGSALYARTIGHSGSGASEWAEFQHAPGRRFEDFDEVRREILRETERICGTKQVIVADPIILKVFSPKVIDLTLVDLPGITRVPVGDQPQDIEQQIRELVLQYISSPRCLILAVVAGNADVATADALGIAREVDPEGNRTIGVVTKLDLVDHGAGVLHLLEGQVYPLKHGFIGVTCRSFRDVLAHKEIRDHAVHEEAFFRTHSVFGVVAHHCGIGYLSTFLNRLLMEHICDAFPDIKSQVLQRIRELETELEGYGECVSLQPGEQGALLLGLFAKFAGRVCDAIEGKFTGELALVPGQLVGRARMDFIFRDVFTRTVRDFDSLSGISDEHIYMSIQNAIGPSASMLVPEIGRSVSFFGGFRLPGGLPVMDQRLVSHHVSSSLGPAFELLVKKQIAKLEAPSLQCAELVFEELQQIVLMSEVPEFRRFRKLREHIFGVVQGILRRHLEPTSKMIKDLIQIELSYINTSHPDFVMGNSNSMRALGFRSRGSFGSNGEGSAGQPPPGSALPAAARTPPGPPMTAAGSRSPPAPSSGQPPRIQHPQVVNPPAYEEDPPAQGGGFFSSLIFRNQARGRPNDRSQDDESAGVPSAPAQRPGEPPQAATAERATPPIGSSTPIRGRNQTRLGTGLGTDVKLPLVPSTITSTAPLSTTERVEVEIIKDLLTCYLSIVKKNITDSVPKAVMFFMVNSLKDVIQRECVSQLYREDLFNELLCESRDVQGRRDKSHKNLQALQRVIEVLGQVRDDIEF